jgi:type II secretory ATPase GspE/PulE/Tfp pilus assembly ATPase PilB-like protein
MFNIDEAAEQGFTWELNDAPINRFILKILLDAIKQKVDRIYLEKVPSVDDRDSGITVTYEADGVCRAVSESAYEVWETIIRRLKVIARTVDDGPMKSTTGEFSIRLSKNYIVDIRMTTNPNHYTDSKVTLVIDDDRRSLPAGSKTNGGA